MMPFAAWMARARADAKAQAPDDWEAPWDEPAPRHPRPVPGTEAGYLVATVDPYTGRIRGWTHTIPLSRERARHEAAGGSMAVCRVEVVEVGTDDR